MKVPNNNLGFTLIELLVVIAIIGIISGIIIVEMSGTTTSATIAKSQAFASSLRNALSQSLISEWNFDPVTGTINSALATNQTIPDSWNALNDGTAKNQPILKGGADCVFGKCLSFNGSTHYIDYGDKDNLSFSNNIFTISFWMNPDRNTNLGILGKRGGPWEYSIHVKTTANTIYFFAYETGGTTVYQNSALFDINQWTHFVWTANGSNSSLYKNGVLYGSPYTKGAYSLSNTTSYFEVGRAGDSSGFNYMSGLIDEIRIFNAALPSSQIHSFYLAGLSKLLKSNQITQAEYRQKINDLNQICAIR